MSSTAADGQSAASTSSVAGRCCHLIGRASVPQIIGLLVCSPLRALRPEIYETMSVACGSPSASHCQGRVELLTEAPFRVGREPGAVPTGGSAWPTPTLIFLLNIWVQDTDT
jgi:hypothetical protein